ncbi:trypsin-like peptidase domain-containing protein [candidate division KSB1 bacterium]|nr:trypsin-like peptidase domain-containing protein [candidate division KSB1 bacterium]
MSRFINFFAIGLIAGLLIFYQYYRNKALETAIAELREQTSEQQAATTSALRAVTPSVSRGEDRPAEIPPFQSIDSEITESRQNAITRAIARSRDAVVGINVVQVKEVANPLMSSDPMVWMMFDERLFPRTIKKKVHNLGSGFVISSDGYIVTNQHVVADAAEVVVSTTGGKKYDAKIVGTDPLLDMALLKIEASGLPSIPLGDSENAIVGEWALAIGNPYGLFDVNDQPSVSVGVISALHRDFESPIDGRLYTDMIQTDASINHGNSGGPLINAEGIAMGMNTLIFSESGGSVGVGFAIPAHRILAAINDLRSGGVNREFWVGLRAQNVSPIRARLNGMDSLQGAVVTMVERNSPAAKAGIQIEDIILEINGRKIVDAVAAGDFFKNTDLRVGDRIGFKISRRGKLLQIPLILAALPNSEARGM